MSSTESLESVQRPQLVRMSPDLAQLSGDLTLDTAHQVLQPGFDALKALSAKGGEHWIVDCQSVGLVSSAALALLLQWWKTANQYQIHFKIRSLPDQLKPLMVISDIEGVLAESLE